MFSGAGVSFTCGATLRLPAPPFAPELGNVRRQHHFFTNAMGYFDAHTANLFRESRDGQRVIAPFGKFGAIYAVPTDAAATRITRVVRRLYQLMLVGIIGVQLTLGWRWNLLFGILWLVVFYAALHLEARRLPRTGLRVEELVPLSRREMQARTGRAMGMGWTITSLVISAAFVVAGAWLWYRSRETSMLLAVAFFGLCGVVALFQLIAVRGPQPPSTPAA